MSENLVPVDRIQEAAQLVEDFKLNEDAEFFSEPQNRLEFISTLDFDDFSSIAEHVNARVRGYEPRDKMTASETGGYLPMMRTPSAEEKPEALRRGFEAIQQYLKDSNDSDEEKVKAVGMATEALIVWVHPFNDGNGRTSRFLGKFIEDGATDTDQLVKEAASNTERMRMYPEYSRVDNTTDLVNQDLILDDAEIEAIKQAQEELPIIEGIEMSITRLMEDKTLQARLEQDTQQRIDTRTRSLERRNMAA